MIVLSCIIDSRLSKYCERCCLVGHLVCILEIKLGQVLFPRNTWSDMDLRGLGVFQYYSLATVWWKRLDPLGGSAPNSIPVQLVKKSLVWYHIKSFGKISYDHVYLYTSTIINCKVFNNDINWASQDLPWWKQCCKSFKVLFFSRCFIILQAIIRSNTLEVTQVRNTGW